MIPKLPPVRASYPGRWAPVFLRWLEQVQDFVQGNREALPPIGSFTMFAGSTPPARWLLCDGSAVSKATYPDLYRVLGSTYGETDTTFTLPSTDGRFAYGGAPGGTGGANEITLSISQIPVHSHGVTDPGHIHSVTDPGHDHVDEISGSHVELIDMGLDTVPSYDPTARTSTETTGITIDSATTGVTIQDTGGGQPFDNRPAFFQARYIIRAT